MAHRTREIFGAPGVGKSTLIRRDGYVSSHELFLEELDRLSAERLRRRFFIPLPRRVLRGFRNDVVHRYEEPAIRDFAEDWREYLDLCLRVIFNSPVSAERRIRCYRFMVQAILSWWLVREREGLVWDESFAKLTLYACGMAPTFSEGFFGEMVAAMPKRDHYIFVDGAPEQGVAGQIRRGKLSPDMTPSEREAKLRSAAKYREVARRLRDELEASGLDVEDRLSGIQAGSGTSHSSGSGR